MELDAGICDLCPSRMAAHVSKVHHVTTITKVAKDLGEDVDWLRDTSGITSESCPVRNPHCIIAA
jgi:hypothetical protein